MKYQDNFPTIWDTPRQRSAKPANQAPAKKSSFAGKRSVFVYLGYT